MNIFFDFFSSFGSSVPNWDLAIILIFIIGALFYGLTLGRERLITILISTYISVAAVTVAPLLSRSTRNLTQDENAFLKILVFLAILAFLFFFLSRARLIRKIRSWGLGNLWQTILFSILQVGLLISLTLSFLPTQRTSGLSQFTKDIFTSDGGSTAWILLPVIFLLLITWKRNNEYD